MFNEIVKLIGLNDNLYQGNFNDNQRNGFGIQLFYGTPFYIGNWSNNNLNGEGLLYLNKYIFILGEFLENKFNRGRICWEHGLYYQGSIYNEQFFLKGEFCYKERLIIRVNYDVHKEQYTQLQIRYLDEQYQWQNFEDQTDLLKIGINFYIKNDVFIFQEQKDNDIVQLEVKTPFQFLYQKYQLDEQNFQKLVYQISSVFYFTAILNQFKQVEQATLLNGVQFERQQEDKQNYYNLSLLNFENIQILSEFRMPKYYLSDFTIHNFKIKDLLFKDCQNQFSLCQSFKNLKDLDCVRECYNFKTLYINLLQKDEKLTYVIAIFIEELHPKFPNFIVPYLVHQKESILCNDNIQNQFAKFKTNISALKRQDLQLDRLCDLYTEQVKILYINFKNLQICIFLNYHNDSQSNNKILV